MSSFFAEEDNITFGVQGSNEAEVAQFSSTRDDVFYRFFTNNFSETDNFVTGTVIGSSNYDKTNAARNNLYFGHVSEYSNVERIMTITEKRVGINTDPTATFHVVGSNVDHSNVVLVETINSPAYPAFTISKWGKVGFGTTPTDSESDVTVKILGKLQVDGLQIGGGATGADGNLISTEGLVSTAGSGSNNYLMFGNNSMCNISSIFLKDSLIAEDNVIASNVLYATNLAPVTGSTIQLSGSDLSNVNNLMINQGSYLAVDNIRGSENPDLIQFNAATLSNIDLVVAVTVETSNLTTTAAGGFINVQGNSLSNISLLSKVTTIDTTKLTTTDSSGFINVDQKSLSNIDIALTNTLVTSKIDTTASFIDVDGNSLSNISLLSKVTTADIATITTTVASGLINVDQKSLSNINIALTNTLVTSKLDTTSDFIDVDGNSLSNIALLSKVNTIDILKLTTTASSTSIDVDQKSLSNINIARMQTAYIDTLHGNAITKIIDATDVTLSNVENILMTPSIGRIYTNYMAAADGSCNIDFLNTDVTNIRNLWVNGDIRARGEFYVLNTTTCNTNMFQIDNDGTGPALVVNQRGPEHIAQFMDDCNIVMFIKDGGQVAIGSYGYSFDDDALGISSMLTVHNPADSNQTAVKIIQDRISDNRLELFGPTCNIVFTGAGRLGMGTVVPEARIHLHHASGDSLEFIRLSSNQTSQFIVTTDGKLGLGTDPALSTHRLDVAGTIRAEGFALGGSTLIDARGMYDSDDSILEFNQNVLSNISIAKPVQVQTVGFGTEGTPAYSWEGDSDTGIFRPDENQVAISTGGVERMRVYDSGQVFVGVSTGNARLTVAHLNGKGLQVENDLTKNRHVVLHETADNDHQYFGMGVNTDVMRYQVGATTASHVFYAGSSSTASDEIMRVEGAGNVGVGTDSILARLHVSKDTAGDTLLVENTSGQDKKFVIDKNGNVGIGTTIVPFSFVVETTDAMVIPRGTDGERPVAPVMGAIRFNTTTSQFEGYGAGNAWGTLGGVKDVNMDTYISAETTPGANNDELRFYNNNVETMRILADGNVGIGTTTAATKLEVAGTIRAPTIEINTLSSTGSVIDVNQKTLSNVDILKSDVIETSFLGGYAANSMVIDTMYSTFSNMDTLKTSTVEVSTLTTVAANNTIDVDQKTLSNMDNLYVNSLIDTDSLYTNVLRTRTQGGTIDMEQSVLSNAAVLSGTEVKLDIVTGLSGTTINFSQLVLSNIDNTRTDTLTVSDITTLNAGGFIEMNAKSLSNITVLSKVGTLDAKKLTVTDGSGVIDGTNMTLSNINTTKTSTLEVSTLSTLNAGNYINVNSMSLSNVTSLSKVGTLDIGKITNTESGTKTIDMDFSILSNVGFMSNVNVLDVSKVMNTRDAFIDFNSQSLSNLSEIKVTTLEVTTLETSDSLNYIDVNNNSLKNIATLSNVDALDVNIIRNTPTSHLNFANNTLSNIAAVKATTLDVTRITTPETGGVKVIDMVGTSLSNMLTLKTTNILTSTMTGSQGGENVIAFTGSTLSNIDNINMLGTGTLYVNQVTTASGDEINFNQKDLVNVRKLRVTGDIQVAGEFFVTNTTTCNTTQMVIDNDGTGPALIVNQSGNQHIAQFMDDSNVVMFIKDGGQTAFGSFGYSIDAGETVFDALVYMNNPADSNQMALHIVHSDDDKDALRIDTFQSNVVFNGLGKLGMGVTSPEARIDVASRDNFTFLKYAASNNNHAFMIGNNGFVGVGTVADTTHAIKAVGIISADQMAMTSVNSSNGWIDFNNISLCNINTLQVTNLNSSSFNATNLVVDTISSVIPQSNIDVTQSSLSNINIARMNTLEVNTITSTGPNIDVYAKTLSNITGVRAMDITTPSITGTGVNNEVNFNYSRVLDIDSLVVRSNITVTLAGLNTYTNLPTDLVRIDMDTGKILDQYISSNICRLMSNGLLNPALLPPVETNRNTLMHTRDRVGIGLRNPQQKLHVHGTQVVTSGRLGIGTTTPLATLHLDDDNAGLSTVYINNRGSIDTMNILGSNQTPVFYITANCNVGVRTANPMYNLHVNGTMYASDAVRTNAITSDSGTINCGTTSLSNILTAHMTNLVVTGSMTVPATIVASTYTESVHTNSISSYNQTDVQVTDPLHITGYSTNLYTAHDMLYGNNTDITRIGLKVDNSILADTLLTISDYRLKKDIVDSDESNDFQAVLDIPVKRFRYKDHDAQEIIGFIAQDVEEVAPLAVRTIRGPIPTITSSAERISDVTIAIESNYEEISVDTMIRMLIAGVDTVRTVVSVINNEVTFDKPLPEGDIFVYGPVVNDVKLLDTERLIPMTFNAIKRIYREAQEQKALLQDVLARLTALEARIA